MPRKEDSIIFKFLTPKAEIRHVVRRIIIGYSKKRMDFRFPITPSGFAYFTYIRYPENMCLHYSDSDFTTSCKIGITNQLYRERPYFHYKGEFYQIGLELYPDIPKLVFGFSGAELLNRTKMFPDTDKDFTILTDKLDKAASPVKVSQLMQEFMISKRITFSTRDLRLREILNKIYRTNGNVSLSSLEADEGISGRHLRRLFKQSLGISPKKYLRIVAFNDTLTKMKETHNSVGRYYDQSHFIKTCKEITGLTPKEFYRQDHDFALDYIS